MIYVIVTCFSIIQYIVNIDYFKICKKCKISNSIRKNICIPKIRPAQDVYLNLVNNRIMNARRSGESYIVKNNVA